MKVKAALREIESTFDRQVRLVDSARLKNDVLMILTDDTHQYDGVVTTTRRLTAYCQETQIYQGIIGSKSKRLIRVE